MKRKAQALVLLTALGGGCVTTDKVEPAPKPSYGVAGTMKQAPNTVGPYGEPVAAAAGKKPTIQQAKAERMQDDNQSGIRQVWGGNAAPRPTPVAGAVAATGALVHGPGSQYGNGRTSIRFAGPSGMKVAWFNGQGANGFTATMVEAPGRYNFPQGAVYRLKLTDFPNRAGLELYPTLEVIPANIKTATFLAHSAVPLGVTEEDLEQVAAGNFVVKVIYLPDPAFQDLAAAGPDEVVSSRLEPGVDPVAEATRRGSVLAILRIGNIDLEAPNTPAMDAPAGGMPRGPMGPPPGGMMPPGMTPPGGMPSGGMMPQNGMMPPGAADDAPASR